MKRDMELIRKILLQLEATPFPWPLYVEIDGYDKATVGRHVCLLSDAGLMSGEIVRPR